MARTLYCWRCDMALPMLDEAEWAQMAPLLDASIEQIQRYRQRHGAPLSDVPIARMYWAAAAKYEAMTGVVPPDPEALWHHRLSLYGPPCVHCSKPLRTPRAKLCAACGRERDPPLSG